MDQRAARTIFVVFGGCVSLVVLGVLSASGAAALGAYLVPAGLFVILLTLVELLLVRRS
jgi:hypothetical protein